MNCRGLTVAQIQTGEGIKLSPELNGEPELAIRSTRVKDMVPEGIWDKIMWGFGAAGALGITGLITACKSCTKHHSTGSPNFLFYLFIFFTGNSGVGTRDVGHRTFNPAFNSDSKTGLIPSIVFCFRGNCFWHGRKEDLAVITTGSQSLISPTSYLDGARRQSGTSVISGCDRSADGAAWNKHSKTVMSTSSIEWTQWTVYNIVFLQAFNFGGE